jgi:hypothetical protein
MFPSALVFGALGGCCGGKKRALRVRDEMNHQALNLRVTVSRRVNVRVAHLNFTVAYDSICSGDSLIAQKICFEFRLVFLRNLICFQSVVHTS